MLAAMKPKGECDVPSRPDPDRARARAGDGDPRRRLGPNGRQSTGSQQSGATSEPASAECRTVEARAARGDGCADRALSRRVAGKRPGGVDLSTGGGAGGSLAEGTQESEGRCLEEGGRQTVLGR